VHSIPGLEMVTEGEAQKRTKPDEAGEEQPAKFLALPSENEAMEAASGPATWQSTPLTPPQTSFNSPMVLGRGRSVGMGLPDDPISPGPGAGLEEIRLWSQRNSLRLEGQQQTILREFHLQKSQLNRLRETADKHALLEARVALLENVPPGQVQLEVTRIEEEVKRHSTGVSSKVEAEFLQLRSELSAFATQIEVSTTHIGAVEAEYQSHVSVAFAKAEAAIERLNGGLAQVFSVAAAAGSSADTSATSTVNFFDYQLTKDTVAKMEVMVAQIATKVGNMPDCHCHHVDKLMSEVEKIQLEVCRLGGVTAAADGA
jgi:hypothetical protein